MTVLFIILAVLLYAASAVLLYRKELLGPIAAFLALACVYVSGTLPMNLNMLITWLCLTLVVTGVTAMQPPALMAQKRGMGYIGLGALAGMAVGLLGYTVTTTPGVIYSVMCLGVIVGIFFGYFMFTRTPAGAELARSRSRFVSYLLAKGFPVAIAAMMLGMVLILCIFTKVPVSPAP